LEHLYLDFVGLNDIPTITEAHSDDVVEDA
jgi:hypothetical protein